MPAGGGAHPSPLVVRLSSLKERTPTKVYNLFANRSIGVISATDPAALKGRPTKRRRMNPALGWDQAPFTGRGLVASIHARRVCHFFPFYFLKFKICI